MQETGPSTSHTDQTSELLLFIIRNLVDDVEAVAITVASSELEDTVFHVDCAAKDVGKLIGKQGRTARSLRTLLSEIAAKHRDRYVLNIQECPAVAQKARGEALG